MILKERELKHSGVKIDKKILFVFCLLDLKCKFAMNVTTRHSPQAIKKKKKIHPRLVMTVSGDVFLECLLSCTQKKKWKEGEEKLSTPLLLLSLLPNPLRIEKKSTWLDRKIYFLSLASSGIIFLIFSGIIGWKRNRWR